MCVRLYPDILVAAEINSIIFFEGIEKPITVSIGDCLAHQRDYSQFGVRNSFIGYDGEEWSKEDYIAYFRRLPDYFTKINDWYEYEVHIDKLVCNNELKLGLLLTQGIYKPCVLDAFGLLKEKHKTKTYKLN